MSLDHYGIATLLGLATKEKGRVIRRGRRSSENPAEFARRASQYDLVIDDLQVMFDALGPLLKPTSNPPNPAPTTPRVGVKPSDQRIRVGASTIKITK